MKKMNRRILSISILVLVIMFISVVGVYAERIIASSIVTYDNQKSKLSSTNVQGAIDELYAKCVSGGATFNLVKYLQLIESSSTVLMDDGTADHNMRYMGASPNNYITFAGEEWRIIGVFNNISNGSGKTETRVKIIRSTPMDKAWDSNNINIWKNASINTELQTATYASNSLIENAVWYLGDPGGSLPIAKTTYEKEREGTVATGNDVTWTGKVGLPYPSDYGFASSACKDGSKTLFQYNDTSCTSTNWLHTGNYQWCMNPAYNTTAFTRFIDSKGYVTHGYSTIGHVMTPMHIRSVVYLKSSVMCKNCWNKSSGTKDNPFQIG